MQALLWASILATPAVACSQTAQPVRRESVRDAGRPATSRPDAGRTAASEIDAAPLDRVLAAHVRNGLVDYAALKADTARRADLDAYVAAVAEAPSPGLATLINAYDAIVVHEILSRFPLRSVRDVRGFFDAIRHRVGRRDVTLNQLEKEWILPTFGDARVHFALNCGARSCPPLASRALRGSTLDASLDAMTREALRSDSFVRIDGSLVRVTSLFDWYRADFERAAGSAVAFLRRYRPDVPEDARLSYLHYDWRLNDAAD